ERAFVVAQLAAPISATRNLICYPSNQMPFAPIHLILFVLLPTQSSVPHLPIRRENHPPSRPRLTSDTQRRNPSTGRLQHVVFGSFFSKERQHEICHFPGPVKTSDACAGFCSGRRRVGTGAHFREGRVRQSARDAEIGKPE